MSDFLQIKKIEAYLPPDQSEVKIGSTDPHSKDVLFTPNTNDPSTNGRWGELLNEGTFVEVQTSFKELKAYVDDTKPIIDQLVDYTNELDLVRKNNELKGYGIGFNHSGLTTVANGWLNIHGYNKNGLPAQNDGWFYYQQDVADTTAQNNGKLNQKRAVLKQKSFGAIPREYNSDLIFICAEYSTNERKWVPFVLALKEELVTEVTSTLTTNEWDKQTEGLTKTKTVQTQLKYPQHSTKQYELRTVFGVTELGLVQGAKFDYFETTTAAESQEIKSFNSSAELEQVSTVANYTNEFFTKKEIIVLGICNVKLNAGTSSFCNGISFLVPESFEVINELLRTKRELLKQRVKQFTECYSLFKKIQLEIEERKLDINKVKADLEQTIREFVVKKKGSELFLEYFNHTHETKYDVLTKSSEYPADLTTTKRIISAELLGEAIKHTWLHGTNSSKVLKLGLAGQLAASNTQLETGLLIKGNLEVIQGAVIQKLLVANDNVEFKKQLDVTGNLNVLTSKITAKDIQSTNQLTANNVTITGTTVASGNVTLGASNTNTEIRSPLLVQGTTTLNGVLNANNNVNVASGKTLTVNGTTRLVGATQLDSSLTVAGVVTANNNVVLNNTNAQSTTVNGSLLAKHLLTVTGNTQLQAGLTVTGVINANNDVVIANTKKLTADLIDVNVLTVKNRLSTVDFLASGNLTVQGTSTLNGATTINNNVILGLATSQITSKGNVLLEKNLVVNGSVNVQQNLTIADTRTLTGDIANLKTVSIATKLTNSVLENNGLATFNNNVNVPNGTTTTKNLTVTTATQLNTLSVLGTTTTKVTTLGSGNTAVTVDGPLVAQKVVTTNALLTANEGITIAAGKSFINHGISTLGGQLQVNNNVILNSLASQSTTVKGNLVTEQNVTTAGQLTVAGVVNANNNVTVATGKVLTSDIQNTNTLTVKTKLKADCPIELNGLVTVNNDFTVPNNRITSKDLTVTNSAQFNTVTTTGQTTTNNTSLGVTTVRETLTVAKQTQLNTLTTTSTSTFGGLATFNQGLTIPTTKKLTTDLADINTLDTKTKLTSRIATELLGSLTVPATSNFTGNVRLSAPVVSEQAFTQNGVLTTNVVNARQVINAQAGLNATGEVIASTNVKGNVLYQANKPLDELYLRKFEGSTGVAALNVPRSTVFLIQRNVTDQMTLKRAVGYENMTFNTTLSKFEYNDEIRFYPGLDHLSFKEDNNIVKFDGLETDLNNKHLFIAFDIKETLTKTKSFLKLELTGGRTLEFKLNVQNQLELYSGSNKILTANVFKDINVRREVFGVIFKDLKAYLVHDGSLLAEVALTGIQQTDKILKIQIGSLENSLLFDLYTLMIGEYIGSQWSDLIVSEYKINYQYSQEVYQCFGKFKYNENLDRVNFAFETASLPIATLQQKGIVQLTNVITDREDIAVTPSALLDFNVQDIYRSKYNSNLALNLNKGLTDTINNVKPAGYDALKLNECLRTGEFTNAKINGKITRQGIVLMSNNKINYSFAEPLTNWFLLVEYNGIQLTNKQERINLFGLQEIEITQDYKTLESDFKNYILINQNGKVLFNGEVLINGAAKTSLASLDLKASQELTIQKVVLFKNTTYIERESKFISKYGFETDLSYEDAPLYNTLCNWNQLRALSNLVDRKIQSVTEKLSTKTLGALETKLVYSEINCTLLKLPKFFIDGALLASNYYSFNYVTKEFELQNGILFNTPKEVTCIYEFHEEINEIQNVGLQITVKRDEEQPTTALEYLES